jgi:hypothetical protein
LDMVSQKFHKNSNFCYWFDFNPRFKL